jgi:hypothetical protein
MGIADRVARGGAKPGNSRDEAKASVGPGEVSNKQTKASDSPGVARARPGKPLETNGLGEIPPNVYQHSPFHVTVYSCLEQRPLHTCVLLGNVPTRVLRAAKQGTMTARRADPKNPNAWPETKWGAVDGELLRGYYGPAWKGALVPDVGFVAAGDGAAAQAEGGSEMQFGNLRNLNALDEDGAVVIVLDSENAASDNTAPGAQRAHFTAVHAGADTQYSEVGVFPQDNVTDLKTKIHIATGIPPYRQHLFWNSKGRPRTTYDLQQNGVSRPPDIRRFGDEEIMDVAGVAIDHNFAEAAGRQEIFVEALDSFELVGVTGGTVYVVDLEEVIAPVRPKLTAAVEDRFVAELLYNGLVLKYWPQLSPDAFLLYVVDPVQLPVAYPRLYSPLFPNMSTDPSEVKSRVMAQQELMRKTYAAAPAVARRYGAQPRNLGVTSATVAVPPPTREGARLNVRNLFDLLATSARWPAAAARFYLDSQGRSRQDITATKIHATAALGGNDDAADINRMLQRTLRRSSVCVVVRSPAASFYAAGDAAPTGLIGGKWLRGRAHLILFSLHDNGSYSLESTWGEDQRYTPGEVIKQVSAAIEPLVDAINGMGLLVFPVYGRSGELSLPSDAAGVRITGMTASAFWPQAINEDAFRQLKNRWREYDRTGITNMKGLQQAGAYVFNFKKGVTGYDPRAIERTVVVTMVVDAEGRQRAVREIGERTQNTYSYLTDTAIAQRWDCVYPGRLVRFHHRTSDVKIEIIGVSGDELRWVWLTVFAFLDSLVEGPAKLANGIYSGVRPHLKGGLRALQDSDPDLFDLRRYDSRATVYSVLCQSPRPPTAHRPEDVAKMSKKQQGRLVKYWNFTEARPAYFECGNAKFPHFSFLEGQHPKGYCLPCCQKTVAFAGSRRDQINSQCFAQFGDGKSEYGEGDLVAASSRHVLSYGKSIGRGRSATMSRFFEEGLLFGTLDKGEYRLLGVRQGFPALPESAGGGFFHAISAAVGHEAEEVAEIFAAAVGAMDAAYTELANGRAGQDFATGNDLAREILETFGKWSNEESLFTVFSPGGAAHGYWEELAETLLAICFDVYLVVVTDPDGTSVRSVANASVGTVTRMQSGAPTNYAVIFKVGQPDGKHGAGGIYPLVVAASTGRRAGPGAIVASLYPTDGELGSTLVTMVGDSSSFRAWDTNALVELVRGTRTSRYVPILRLVGVRGLCYAVVFRDTKLGENVYASVSMSAYSETDSLAVLAGKPVAVHHGAQPANVLGSAKALGAFLTLFTGAEGRADPTAVVVGTLVHAGLHVGVALRFPPPTGVLYFYHAAGAAVFPEGKAKSLGVISFPSHPRDVDRAIWASREGLNEAAVPAAAEAEAYLSRLRRLLLGEVAAHFYGLKNASVRAALAAVFPGGKAKPAVLEVFKDVLAAAMPQSPARALEDLNTLQDLLVGGAAAFRAGLAREMFNFDRAELYELWAAPAPAAAAAVREILDGLTVKMPLEQIVADGHARPTSMNATCTAAPPGPAVENSPYTACVRVPGQPSKLAVPVDRYDAFVAIVAADVCNPLTRDTLVLRTTGVLDDLDFARRPGEKLVIRT